MSEIAKTGSNAVRLVWTTEGDENEFDQLIQNSLDNNMIPVAELHDATGDFSKLQLLLDYWKRPAVLDLIQKHKKWLIVNIGNEVGAGGETVQQWVDYYKDAITQLRDAGIDAPLMIDCGGFGSFEHYFLQGGEELLAHDPLHNVIFSVHTYWFGGTSADKIQRLNNMVADARSKKLPYIIGEGPQLAASPSFCNEIFPYTEMIDILQREKIGWLSWSWGLVNNNDCGAPNSVFDVTTDGTFGNWATPFAEEISTSDPNSIQNTSIIPESLLTNVCPSPSAPENYTVRARGVQGDEEISLIIDNQTIQTWTVSTSFQDFGVSTDATGTVRVEYTNDSDIRDVQIDYVVANGETFESEYQPINTGVWQDQCGGSYSEWINCSGYIQYDVTEAPVEPEPNYTVRARGVQGDEEISLIINDQQIQTWTVTTVFQDYTISTDVVGTVRLEYTNDSNIRDVQIDYVVANGETFQSEDQLINTGVWQGQCGGSNSEWIHCNGYIQYETNEAEAAEIIDTVTETTYVVRARGVQGDEEINLIIDDQIVYTWALSTSFLDYHVTTEATGTIRIDYGNDSFSRDVQIDYLAINGETFQSEDQLINTGVWQGQCGGSFSEWIHCNGYIQFDTSAPSFQARTTSVTEAANLKEEAESFVVYANSANGTIHVKNTFFNDPIQLAVYTTLGNLVFTKENIIANDLITIETSLPSGMYLVTASNGQQRVITRLPIIR
ncbi:MAG: carbohydrate-binding domain-containing protein [Bacteroidota bacterium]